MITQPPLSLTKSATGFFHIYQLLGTFIGSVLLILTVRKFTKLPFLLPLVATMLSGLACDSLKILRFEKNTFIPAVVDSSLGSLSLH